MKIESATQVTNDTPDLSSMMLVDNILLKHHIFAIISSPKQGKSLILLNLLASLLLGENFANRKVRKLNSVLYISGEGNFTLGLRVKALREQFNSNLDGLHIIRSNGDFNIYNPNSYAHLLDIINEHFSLELLPQLIVFDTIRSMSFGQSETNENFANLFQGAKLLQSQLECSVGFIHHSLKNEKGTYSGGNNFEGSLDTLLVLNEGKLKLSKSKDLPCDYTISSYEIVGFGDSAIVRFYDNDSNDDNDIAPANSHYSKAMEFLEQQGDSIPSVISIARYVFNPNATSVSPKQKELISQAITDYKATQFILSVDRE